MHISSLQYVTACGFEAYRFCGLQCNADLQLAYVMVIEYWGRSNHAPSEAFATGMPRTFEWTLPRMNPNMRSKSGLSLTNEAAYRARSYVSFSVAPTPFLGASAFVLVVAIHCGCSTAHFTPPS